MWKYLKNLLKLLGIFIRPSKIRVPGKFKMRCGELPITASVDNPPNQLTVTVKPGGHCFASFQYWTAGNAQPKTGVSGQLIKDKIIKIEFRCAATEDGPGDGNEQCEWDVK